MLNRLAFSLALMSASIAAAQYSAPTPAPSGSKMSSEKAATAGCPWLTEGTAATALGVDVLATVNVSDSGEGVCKFSGKPSSADSLEIMVSKASLPTCPEGSRELKGIGNEAMRCTHGHVVEMISSRVRDLHFTVTITSHRQKNDAKADELQNDPLEQVAEQVAGSLY